MASGYQGRPDFDHASALRIGVLLINLGTPSAATPAAVRRYLAEFLWDPRVVEQPRWLWWLILHGIVLRVRPRRSARAYASVWTEQGSPLMVNCLALTDALRDRFEQTSPTLYQVELAMRYGEPSVDRALSALSAAGVSRLLVLPLYPQYSATTTGSAFDALSNALQRRRWVPELRFVGSYHDDDAYIAALASSISEHWREHGRPDRLLLSFHGIPRRYFLAGDPYHCHCRQTARLVADALALEPGRWAVSFQSRVGREPWLQPYTDVTLEQWGRDKVATVDVVCPGFSADCLETLEEIAEENRDRFERAGGGRLRYIPALNARDDHVGCLHGLLSRASADWLQWAAAEAAPDRRRRDQRQARARALGATR